MFSKFLNQIGVLQLSLYIILLFQNLNYCFCFLVDSSDATDLRCPPFTNNNKDTEDHIKFPNVQRQFIQLDATDKYQHLNYSAQLKSIDIATNEVNNEFEYMRNLKENNKYFVKSNYSNQKRDFNNSIECGESEINKICGDDSQEKHINDEQNTLYDDNVADFEDSMSNNDRDMMGTSCKSGNINLKRKRFNNIMDEANGMLKYKNNSICGDDLKSGFDCIKNFEDIRSRNCDGVQNDDYNRQNSVDGHNNRNNDDAGVNSNINYASSDDLNQTNSSEICDKGLSGSEDESTGIILIVNYKFISYIHISIIIK